MTTQYHGPLPERCGDFVFGLERIANVLHEVKLLHAAHWEETEKLYLSHDINPDYEKYILLEENAMFLLFTCRDTTQDGKLVGDLMYYVDNSMHIKGVLQATEDAFFLLEEARSGRVAIKYLQYAEKVLVELGVKLIGMSDKSPCGGKSLEKFMNRLGYRPVSINYGKEVGEKP